MLNLMLLPLAAEEGAGSRPCVDRRRCAAVPARSLMAALLAFGKGREHS